MRVFPADGSCADGLNQVLNTQRTAFLEAGFPDLEIRKDRLDRFSSMLLKNVRRLGDAAAQDFGHRSREFGTLFALSPLIESSYYRVMLRRWMRPRRTSLLLSACGIDQKVRREPKGVVGVIGPWNFPSELTLTPAASALAAGNRVMIWQSPAAPETARVVAEMVAKYFSVDELAVFSEPYGTGELFSQLNFDHLFFTGSPQVGALVAGAAAKNLVPVTLELGGKNPAVIAAEGDIDRAARVLAALRLLNSGQACICPDYVFVPAKMVNRFIERFLAECAHRYSSPRGHASYTSIVDERQHRRVLDLIEQAQHAGARIWQLPTGPRAAVERKIPPTVITGVRADMSVAQEEVFGPVLCVYPYENIDEAIGYINARDSPLTMYWFGPKGSDYRKLLDFTRSGSVNIGDGLLHLASPLVPFGGIGRSGSGAYHGRYGFDTFSYVRPTVQSHLPFSVANFAAPPYPEMMNRIIAKVFRQMAPSDA
ncbi:coniferyl-aldehyde dehydrogenase [Mycobacteroides chelonae]|nr:coniferyl-aldehyde dehydrogenase [Mycobacteroides chelonae]